MVSKACIRHPRGPVRCVTTYGCNNLNNMPLGHYNILIFSLCTCLSLTLRVLYILVDVGVFIKNEFSNTIVLISVFLLYSC